MDESLEKSFGIAIAYLVPGFVCLGGASRFSATVSDWMSIAPAAEPSVGGFLYATLGSLGAGLICNAFRWALIDTVHHRTGLCPPELDFAKLQPNIDAFQLAVEHNYRFYQFHSSMVLAIFFYAVADQFSRGLWSFVALAGLAVLEAVLFATSRDNLKRYYSRTRELLKRND